MAYTRRYTRVERWLEHRAQWCRETRRRWQEGTMCTRHYHSPCPLSIHRHHRRPNPYPPVVPAIPFRIRRDGNLAESFAIYDGANARGSGPPSVPLGTYLGLYARKMNSVISRSAFSSSTMIPPWHPSLFAEHTPALYILELLRR